MNANTGQYQGNLQYAVDIVLCVDATASMFPVLDTVKSSALQFHERLNDVMAKKGKAISQLRLKVIAFRDFGDDPSDAIEQTDSCNSRRNRRSSSPSCAVSTQPEAATSPSPDSKPSRWPSTRPGRRGLTGDGTWS